MKKNITDSFQQHLTDTIRKVHESEKPKKLDDLKQDWFVYLCQLQQNRFIRTYREVLNHLKSDNF